MKKSTHSIIISIFLLLFLVKNAFGGDLNELYLKDYDGFWEHWNKTKNEAVSCTDIKNTSIFLRNALETLGNAEVTEANSNEIEKLAVNRPECLLQGLSALIPENQNKFISNFLLNPTYNDTAIIEKSLNHVWNKEIYADLKAAYYKIKKSS